MKERALIIETLFMRLNSVREASAQNNGEVVTVNITTDNTKFEIEFSETQSGYKIVDTGTFREYQGEDLGFMLDECGTDHIRQIQNN